MISKAPREPKAQASWAMRAQDGLARGFGIAPSDRRATVLTMLRPSAGQRASYWLQLVIAMTIATLGLVLGSTAVVIGAMLISPQGLRLSMTPCEPATESDAGYDGGVPDADSVRPPTSSSDSSG